MGIKQTVHIEEVIFVMSPGVLKYPGAFTELKKILVFFYFQSRKYNFFYKIIYYNYINRKMLVPTF